MFVHGFWENPSLGAAWVLRAGVLSVAGASQRAGRLAALLKVTAFTCALGFAFPPLPVDDLQERRPLCGSVSLLSEGPFTLGIAFTFTAFNLTALYTSGGAPTVLFRLHTFPLLFVFCWFWLLSSPILSQNQLPSITALGKKRIQAVERFMRPLAEFSYEFPAPRFHCHDSSASLSLSCQNSTSK